VPPYQQTSQPAPRPAVYSMAQNPYPPNHGYGTSAPMMPQTTAAISHPQPIAPAPIGGRGPPVLRPMPPGGLMAQPGMASPYGPGALMQPNSVLQEEQPTHVVGSQGRRGILPSAPGRPAATAVGVGAKSTVIPVKDADGKFPCPHCTKTYLHAKHLKRHLLRRKSDPSPNPGQMTGPCHLCSRPVSRDLCILTIFIRYRRPPLHVCALP
jgi:hypothetical protein